AFYPDCIFNTTTVLAKVENYGFKATGKVILDPGWRTIYAHDRDKEAKEVEEENKDNAVLPPFTIGESGPQEPSLIKKSTQPPKPYTEGTLLRAMESAGKTVDDEALREAMKENGIGRPSTRSAIIETLFKRRYIKRERKNIQPTQAGIDLVDIIREEMLKSAKLTGLWENKLRRIERGTFSAAEFISELKDMVSNIVMTVLSDNSNRKILTEAMVPSSKKSAKKTTDNHDKPKKAQRTTKKAGAPKDFSEILCPVCGEGRLIKGNTAIGCNRYKEGCSFRIPFDQLTAVTPVGVMKYMKARRK
ncbi:MAG: DNA topoisomerase III, partial [Muribaculaceae bacterium]|nr:DNA topoisomerase III [Muribaculaceae bacterium]